MSQKRIAVIAGDGIGQEVMPEGVRVLEAVAGKFGIDLQFDHFDFSSWDYFEQHGQMLPDDWKAQIGGHDAVYFGAVGWPDKIADHVSLWGSLLLLGDGIATAFAGFMGGPPNTTYSEVTGAVALTKITDPRVLRIAAITAIVFSLIGKISAVLKTIPPAVLGGIMLLLFGMIASIGIKTLIEAKTDFSITRNQVIVSVILTIGIGGAQMSYGNFSLAGIGLASVIGVILNLILPKTLSLKKGTFNEIN